MTTLQVRWTTKTIDYPKAALEDFFSAQTKRLIAGYYRYLHLTTGQRMFFTRLQAEVKAYKKTGNREHLINVANYAFLEAQKLENKKFHWAADVPSVTRKEEV